VGVILPEFVTFLILENSLSIKHTFQDTKMINSGIKWLKIW
jgi:hypothetical protein